MIECGCEQTVMKFPMDWRLLWRIIFMVKSMREAKSNKFLSRHERRSKNKIFVKEDWELLFKLV